MNEETDIIFREKQKFAMWLRWLVYLSVGLVAGLNIFALQKGFAEKSLPETKEIFLAVMGLGQNAW
jgi:hypothetical protein